MGALSSEERPAIGQIANEIRESVEKMIAEKGEALGRAFAAQAGK